MHNNHWTILGGATAVFLAAAYVFWGPSKPKKRKAFPGLLNFGSSCYLNVILQSWAACPSLLRWLSARRSSHHPHPATPLTTAILKVLKVLNNDWQEPPGDVYSPDDVLTAMDRKGWVISSGQQDCHELMQALSATLDEETCVAPRVISLFDVTALQDSRSGQASQGLAKTRMGQPVAALPRRQESPLHGLLASQLQCLTCGHQSPVKYDVFDCLTLTMPASTLLSKLDLQHLLGRYVSPEVIEAAHCANCSLKAAADLTPTPTPTPTQSSVLQRTLTIGKLPQCLCLHLQRLHCPMGGVAVKRQEHVSFPHTLAMDPFLYSAAATPRHTSARRLCGGKQRPPAPAPANPMHRSSAAVNLLRALNYDACHARNGLFLRPPSPLLLPPAMADVNHNGPAPLTDVNHNGPTPLPDSGPAPLPDVNHNGPAFFTSKVGGQHRYYLTAVISHLGDVESGHFVTFRRGPLQPTSEHHQRSGDTWWFTSDCRVHKTSLEQVMASQAYMLFYEKI
ncbi:hypothetical protein ACOMHN_023335 [Nucella lapillus]